MFADKRIRLLKFSVPETPRIMERAHSLRSNPRSLPPSPGICSF